VRELVNHSEARTKIAAHQRVIHICTDVDLIAVRKRERLVLAHVVDFGDVEDDPGLIEEVVLKEALHVRSRQAQTQCFPDAVRDGSNFLAASALDFETSWLAAWIRHQVCLFQLKKFLYRFAPSTWRHLWQAAGECRDGLPFVLLEIVERQVLPRQFSEREEAMGIHLQRLEMRYDFLHKLGGQWLSAGFDGAQICRRHLQRKRHGGQRNVAIGTVPSDLPAKWCKLHAIEPSDGGCGQAPLATSRSVQAVRWYSQKIDGRH
jgi:hypothetical protein